MRMEDLLGRMNVPTKNDIDALSAKITALTKKVDELKKA
jgi:polyhydroxyalkanoate synthesis regulator phasin